MAKRILHRLGLNPLFNDSVSLKGGRADSLTSIRPMLVPVLGLVVCDTVHT